MSSFCGDASCLPERRGRRGRSDCNNKGGRGDSLYLFSAETINLDSVQGLITAAVSTQGDKASLPVQGGRQHERMPWFFSVIQDKSMLSFLADDAAKLFLPFAVSGFARAESPAGERTKCHNVADAVQNALALITLYGRKDHPGARSSCWQGAENMIVAAAGLGLRANASSVFVPPLNMHRWKDRLGVPDDLEAVAPVIIRPLEGALQGRAAASAA